MTSDHKSLGEFGVVIPAKEEHLHWVRGTCASVRHFMGDTPICVLLDGTRFADDLREAPGVSVLRLDEVEPAELRSVAAGSLRAKNVVLWAAPFETFLSVDADTVVWGDMRELINFDDFDFLLDNAGEPLRSVMDIEAVSELVAGFHVMRHVGKYANSGAYFGRRGVLNLERYIELMKLSAARPGMFYGSQGVFNLMLFEAADRGDVRVGHRELQLMTGRTTREDVVRRIALVGSTPMVTGDPIVLHWVGSPKPRIRQRGRDYFLPMTYFRHEFLRAARRGSSRFRDDLRLRVEDMLCTDWRGTNARGRFARLLRRGRQRYVTYKVSVRRRTPNSVVAFVFRRSPARDRQI